MSIFKAKYQAHRFVNYIFYFVVFAVGLVIGLGFKNVKLDDLLSKFLMIDTAYAYSYSDIPYDSSASDFTRPTSSNWYTEEIIYNLFEEINSSTDLDLDFSDYSHVIAYCLNSGVFNCSNNYRFYFFTTEPTGDVTRPYFTGDYVYLKLDYTGSPYSQVYYATLDDYQPYVNNMNAVYASTNTNFSSDHYLDFSNVIPPDLEYDENLFANDSNFKEVCVNNYDTFSITSKEYDEVSENGSTYRTYTAKDSIWFKGYIHGLNSKFYHADGDEEIAILHNYISDTYYFNSVDMINTIYSTMITESVLKNAGYTDKYSYYGYSSHLFYINFNNSDNSATGFQVFSFNNGYIEDLEGNKTYPGQFCFYIKNEFDVNILNEHTIDSVGGSVTILGDNNIHYNVSIDSSSKNYEYHDLRSSITSFITQMFPTIHTININIYHLYMSMPELVRLFVISLITLIFIRFILKLVMK